MSSDRTTKTQRRQGMFEQDPKCPQCVESPRMTRWEKTAADRIHRNRGWSAGNKYVGWECEACGFCTTLAMELFHFQRKLEWLERIIVESGETDDGRQIIIHKDHLPPRLAEKRERLL